MFICGNPERVHGQRKVGNPLYAIRDKRSPSTVNLLLLDLNLFQKSIITRSLAQNTLNNVIFSAYFFNCCANANFTLATVLYGSKAYAMIHLPIKII